MSDNRRIARHFKLKNRIRIFHVVGPVSELVAHTGFRFDGIHFSVIVLPTVFHVEDASIARLVDIYGHCINMLLPLSIESLCFH